MSEEKDKLQEAVRRLTDWQATMREAAGKVPPEEEEEEEEE